ncbi:carbohydrate-binding protein [Alteromonas sp. 5E99-2]|uniref:carbohydrate-binding protein n=1 Tax=Alteromonas sp. 5E99-2 TaxID=2817683 RepID=UPI001A9925E6|nr:carbohydrate-binding domain-containing protein [Alteromonas sp. 5E99-2]MBO1256192.1 carbohydrate-binding protein [Alteromonas sp. 5E99-2]
MFQKTARSQLQMKGKRALPLLLLSLILPIASSANAQVGGLLWEENFNTLDPSIWKIDEGNGCEIGLCGWGNLEREYYSPNNVSIEAVPGEAGNNALVMEARSENATDTFGNNFVYTSGKIHSENGLAVQYGMIETRIRVPDLQNGLWPAFWMLGTTTAGWPRKGELDIMEMGQSDAGIISHGHPGTPQNNFVGANAIFYSDDACVVGNETCAASTAYQTDNAYVSTVPMNDRFIVYRMYWTDTEIRFTAIDQGVEYDMYDNPIPITEESAELAEPFYFLMNLAIGGNFTGFLNDSEISAPLPAKMYVDYIRVYEFNGLGEVTEGNFANQEFGTFGVFTDNAVVDNQLEPGVNSDIFIWNTNSTGGGTEAPYEGENAISWEYHTPGLWFGGGVQARQPLDMSSFLENGNLTFNIKIPADISFRIGITDTFTNQNWVVFSANQTAYGLVRDGEWGSVTIPVSELQGELIALQSTEYPFAIVSLDTDLPTNTFQFAIDNILWEGGGDAPVDDNAPEPGTNLALNKTTSQSSTRFNGQSTRAVDGNTSGVYRDASVTHTASENEPWWQVDLGSVEDITHINIFNRTDSCCVSRLTDFYVFVSNVPFTSNSVAQTVNSNQVSSVYYDGTLNGSDTITVNTQGQYVRIQLIGTNPLSLAEVEVIAGEAPPAPPRTAVLVEAEDYTAFLDTDAGNNGNQYRSDDVDIEISSDENGGFNVGWTTSGEWLEYSVQLQAGSYEIESRVASVTDTGEFLISINQQVVGSASVDATGGWQNWVTLPSGEVSIPSDGIYTIRIDVTGSSFNINYFTLLPVDSDVGIAVP